MVVFSKSEFLVRSFYNLIQINTMRFSLISLALATAASTVIADGGFTETCYGWVLTGTNLAATCYDDNEEPVLTSINLNNCIANDNAVLAVCNSLPIWKGGFKDTNIRL